jgi:hypothetical protein
MLPDLGSRSRLTEFTTGIWTSATPIRFAGVWFPHVMTVVRLSDESLLLHSPCRPSDELHASIQQLGAVAHVVAPNWFHDLYLFEYRKTYPEATFWGPSKLRWLKGARLIDRVLDGQTRPPWFDEMPHLSLRGFLTFDECVFFHIPSKTLIVADVLFNLSADRALPWLTRTAYKVTGVDSRLVVFPVLRVFSPLDRPALKADAARILRWDIERLIVAHGNPIENDAFPQVRKALRWLQL